MLPFIGPSIFPTGSPAIYGLAINTGTPTKQIANRMSPTMGASSSGSVGGASSSADSFGDRQFMVITSEKTARVIALPSQNCVYRQQITDTDYVVKAEIISLKGTAVNFCCPLFARSRFGAVVRPKLNDSTITGATTNLAHNVGE